MAEINLGNDTNITTTISTDTPISANVPDINYIPGYQIAEEERRANEVIRQENEANRITLYEDMENKLATGYFDGVGLNYDWEGTNLGVKREDESEYSYTDLKGDTGNDGVSPSASVTRGTGSATITVTDASGTTTAVIYDGEKGEKGDKGDPGAIKTQVVQELPTTGAEDTIYLVPITPDTSGNNYAEYMYINGAWELLGKVGIATDLTDYVKNTDYASLSKAGVVKTNSYSGFNVGNGGGALCDSVTYSQYEGRINDSFISKGTLENVITGKGLVSSSSLSTVATTGSYNDLLNKPTIPNELADLTDDSTHRLVTDTDKTNWNNKVDSSGNATTTSQNTSFNLTNTLEAPLEIDLKGNTSQTGTPTPSSPIPVNNVSGDNDIVVNTKNFFNVNEYKEKPNSITISDNKIIMENAAYTPIVYVIKVNNNTTYNISCNSLNTNIYRLQVKASDSSGTSGTTIVNGSIYALSYSESFITTSEYIRIEIFQSTSTSRQEVSNIQLELGNQATPYEENNGNTYNIDLPVENLFDKDSYSTMGGYTSQSGKVSSDANATSIKIAVQPNTTYTISRATNYMPDWMNNVIGFTTNPNLNDTGTTLIIGGSSKTLTFTTGANDKYIVFAVRYPENAGTLNDVISTLQIEYGSKKNTYTPYGTTPIELNKIGTYQDYIYKENDKWYLHKEVGKVVLTGDNSENWSLNQYGFFQLDVQNSTSSSEKRNGYSNRFVYAYNTSTDNTFFMVDNLIRIRCNTYSNTTDFKTFLSNNNAICYFIYATPTNTEITYTPLIEQLNTLEEAQSKEGTTNINQVNNDLPFIINATVFNDNYNGRYEALLKRIEKLEENA